MWWERPRYASLGLAVSEGEGLGYLRKVDGLVGRTGKNLIARYASARVWGCLFNFGGKNEKEPDSKVCVTGPRYFGEAMVWLR